MRLTGTSVVTPTHPTPPSTGLWVRGVEVWAASRLLLTNISLHLMPGQIGALLGPNGAGKSTLLGAIAGLKPLNQGEVTLDGTPVAQPYLPALARRRAVLPQDTSVAFDFCVREVVELGRYPHRLHPSPHEAAIVEAAMAMTGVSHLAGLRIAWLSGGERLRVQLARVLAQIWEPDPDGAPRWLLLDEPTAALDLQYQHSVLAAIRSWARQHRVGVLMVLHDLNLALRYTDFAWVLSEGRIVAQGPVQQALDERRLAQVWRVRATAVDDGDGVRQLLTTGSEAACFWRPRSSADQKRR